ncbi:MAG: ImmA/IrrE family metallo-endopeptidase [Gemmatimonadetes bacterium]|nr:ImmA/IrrE family metallo-endopeptidase [Gemmatimonadota bacterium]MYF63801.1 ImmA/IrrE family metallo-endopeptidase [Rhodothermaceae bacterium]MYK53486.1 ImmA/IrrE family metallo-endopeptidase [Gemmatimonadota bacterium]
MRKVSSHRQKSLVRRAERLLQDENLLELPVDLEALSQTRGILIREMEADEEGVSGMLLRHGDTFGILYSTQIPNIGFQRFSIAHELGHYFIDGHLDQIPFDDNVHRSRADFVSNNYYEREADHFAAGLLMPITPVRRIIHRSPSGLGGIQAVQEETNASLTAAAIRYVGMTDEAVAIIVSSNGIVDYCFMSGTMKSLEGIDWLHKNTLVPSDTITESTWNKSEEEQREAYAEGEIDITAWFGGRRSVAAGEEVIGLGSYGRVLTVLTCHDLIDNDYIDEVSDEALEESWTPRFRR